jgi:hypothetical protein
MNHWTPSTWVRLTPGTEQQPLAPGRPSWREGTTRAAQVSSGPEETISNFRGLLTLTRISSLMLDRTFRGCWRRLNAYEHCSESRDRQPGVAPSSRQDDPLLNLDHRSGNAGLGSRRRRRLRPRPRRSRRPRPGRVGGGSPDHAASQRRRGRESCPRRSGRRPGAGGAHCYGPI